VAPEAGGYVKRDGLRPNPRIATGKEKNAPGEPGANESRNDGGEEAAQAW
jgi:hypothetical protein